MLITENDHDSVHQNYMCLLVILINWVVPLHKICCRFLNFPPYFYQRNRDSRSCACYKVYGVDKLTDNWNLYMKESTRSKSTLYLPSVENMIAYILWWLPIIFMSKVFVQYFFFQLRGIQCSSKYRSIGVLGEEGRKLIWMCCASQSQHFDPALLLITTLAGGAWQHVSFRFNIFIMDNKWP